MLPPTSVLYFIVFKELSCRLSAPQNNNQALGLKPGKLGLNPYGWIRYPGAETGVNFED